MTQNKRLYESGPVWDRDLQLGQKNLLQALKDFFPPNANTVLDVGCGDGKITRALIAATGREITGLDSSPEALSRCDFETVNGDATALPYADRQFDLVMTTDMLEHLPEEMEERAWRELFRVAATFVMVAVPFREELLDATARCQACGSKYHVNWHMRRYDWPELISRAPAGWKTEAIALTGEPWSPYHPLETRFRRELLDEWSGWTEAICPNCGGPGSASDEISPVPRYTASALGTLIYADLEHNGISRSHSELLVLYRRAGSQSVHELVLSPAKAVERDACLALIDEDPLETDLVPYPDAVRKVAAADGSTIIQLPVYGNVRSLVVEWCCGTGTPVPVVFEDGLGAMFSGEFRPNTSDRAVITLPRDAVPGYYGALVRFAADCKEIFSIQLGGGVRRLALTQNENTGAAYHRFNVGGCNAFIQVTQPLKVDMSCLARRATPRPRLSWGSLFRHIDSLVSCERASLVAERNSVAANRDSLLAERDSLIASLTKVNSRPEVRLSTRIRRRLGDLKTSHSGEEQ